jgi:hypothetical protein
VTTRRSASSSWDEGRPVADAVGDGGEGETVERAPSFLGQLAAGAELLGGGAREGERHEPIGWQPLDGDRLVDLAGDGGGLAGAPAAPISAVRVTAGGFVRVEAERLGCWSAPT